MPFQSPGRRQQTAGKPDTATDPELLTFANWRAAQKARFGGEFFIAESVACLDAGVRLPEDVALANDVRPALTHATGTCN